MAPSGLNCMFSSEVGVYAPAAVGEYALSGAITTVLLMVEECARIRSACFRLTTWWFQPPLFEDLKV